MARLDEIASLHAGPVPLHSRLFRQWMHHAYPRECPYPHEAGDLSVKIAKEENDLKTMRVVTAVQYRILRDKVDTAVFDIVNPEAMRRAEVDSIL